MDMKQITLKLAVVIWKEDTRKSPKYETKYFEIDSFQLQKQNY